MECDVDTVDYIISGTSFYLDIVANRSLKWWLILHVRMYCWIYGCVNVFILGTSSFRGFCFLSAPL